MNVKRLEKLASTIETKQHVDEDYEGRKRGFNMAEWKCGSIACIGGWVEWLWKPDGRHGVHHVADVLDIGHGPALDLCYPGGQIDIEYSKITPAQAAKVIRHLAETEAVDWAIILENETEAEEARRVSDARERSGT